MKVRYIRSEGDEPSLTFNKTYFVFGVEFSSKFMEPSQYIQFRILDDEMQITLCKAKDFEIIEGEIGSDWKFLNRKVNDYSIMPKCISYNSFWEEYYDGSELALKLLNDIYTEMIAKYSSESEIKEMIKSKDIRQAINAIRALKHISENLYDKIVENRIASEIKELMNYSNTKVNQLIFEGFEYLSQKTGDFVEELFLSYYEHTELHCEKLDEIVSSYFSKQVD